MRPGPTLVAPDVASWPVDLVRREIRGAALRDALPADFYQLPLGDRAAVYNEAVLAADRAVAAFERIRREEAPRLRAAARVDPGTR